MIHHTTTVVLPCHPALTQLGDIDTIEIQADGSVIIGARGVLLAAPRNEGRPLVAIWDEHANDREGQLLAIGYSSTQGEPLTQEHADAIVTAIGYGHYANQDEVDALVLEGQKAAMPTAAAMIDAPLTKLREGDRAGYMRQWHTRTGNVRSEYDELAMLHQITGFDWDNQLADLREDDALARDAVRVTLGEDRLERFHSSDDDASVYDEACDHTHTVFVHRSGIAAVMDVRDEDTLTLAILVPGAEGPVTRTVDLRPTIERKPRTKKAA